MRRYLAPMEGITGYIFRGVYHDCFGGMDKYFTPFLSPNQTGKLGPRELRDVDPDNNKGMYVVPQILTNSAPDFVRTAKTLKAMGYGEVNLNLGCPSGTVVSKRRGAGFLAQPEELDRCLYDIFAGLDMKISVKTRLGVKTPDEFHRLLDVYNRYELEELIIHPRVREDYYRNTPHMDAFERAFARSRAPVCYNGDIFRQEDIERLRDRFPGLLAVMMGRGIVAYPGLLFCRPGGEQADAGTKEAKRRLREFHDRLYEANRRVYLKEAGPRVVLFKMKEIWCYMLYAFQDGEKAAKKIKKAQRPEDYEAAVNAVFGTCQVIEGGGYYGTP
ncbi:MAG: tRNA-dihydrouridine synthase family protein [Hungatella sp.]|nr:tRNA-dihydrouridine synthase family protein [Hungatella sp.]